MRCCSSGTELKDGGDETALQKLDQQAQCNEGLYFHMEEGSNFRVSLCPCLSSQYKINRT